MGDLKKMLNPKTVAFVGADDREGSAEISLLHNLLSGGRTVFPVNRDKKKVLDLDCYPSVSDIDAHIDLAVVATSDELVFQVTEECGKKGVEGAIILSGGAVTLPEDRRELEKGLREIRKDYGLRIIGPGSSGIVLPNEKLNAAILNVNPVPGNIAFISQSGTMGNAMLCWGVSNHIGFSMFASLGSMVDVDCADLIDFLQEDYFTRSIMIYLEHIKDTRKFLSASRCFARNKPIVVLKPGRYPQSAEMLRSYSGMETGSDMVYDAAFRRAGLVRAKETVDFFDTAKVLVSRSLPRGPRLAIVTNSRSIGIIACDILAEQRGHLVRFSEKSLEMLDRVIEYPWGRTNPVDLSGNAAVERYTGVVDVCLKDNEVDGVLIIYAPSPYCDPGELARQTAGLAMKTSKLLIAVWMGGQYAREGIEVFKETNIPVYNSPEDAVRAYMYMVNYRTNIMLLNETPEELPENEMKPTNHLRAIIRNAVKDHREVLTGGEASGFVKNYGIPVLKEPATKEQEEALEPPIDEWALRSMRDIDFGTVILFISMSSRGRHGTGFAVGMPPLNQVLARHLMEEADFRSAHKSTRDYMAKFLVSFSNFVADFPEISEIEIEAVVMPDNRVYAKNVTIQADAGYQEGIEHYPHLTIMPYPSRYIMPWRTPDGRDMLLRPIRAEDEPLMKEMMSALSEETMRVRFFGALEINHRMLAHFCNIDYGREITIAAELKEGDKKRIIGGGQLIVEPDTGSGQFALLVSDDFQKQGLGEKLLDVVIGIAQDKGLHEVYGIVLSENVKMLGLSRKLGFNSTMLPDGITRVTLELN